MVAFTIILFTACKDNSKNAPESTNEIIQSEVDHEGHDHGDMEEAQSQDSTNASENMDMEGDQEADDMKEEEEGDQPEEQ
jgi:hypothetical protein